MRQVRGEADFLDDPILEDYLNTLGDKLAARHPNSGRILCSQISSGSAAVLSVLLLRGVPNGPLAFPALLVLAAVMGFMVSWNAPATNK